MYIDEKVDLRDNLPTALQHDFEELQIYYEAGDWFMFDTIFEVVEASVKAYYLAGKITRDDLNCIFRKYGIDWNINHKCFISSAVRLNVKIIVISIKARENIYPAFFVPVRNGMQNSRSGKELPEKKQKSVVNPKKSYKKLAKSGL